MAVHGVAGRKWGGLTPVLGRNSRVKEFYIVAVNLHCFIDQGVVGEVTL